MKGVRVYLIAYYKSLPSPFRFFFFFSKKSRVFLPLCLSPNVGNSMHGVCVTPSYNNTSLISVGDWRPGPACSGFLLVHAH